MYKYVIYIYMFICNNGLGLRSSDAVCGCGACNCYLPPRSRPLFCLRLLRFLRLLPPTPITFPAPVTA